MTRRPHDQLRFLDGMTIDQAKEEVAKRLETENRGNAAVGERQVEVRLRDSGISCERSGAARPR